MATRSREWRKRQPRPRPRPRTSRNGRLSGDGIELRAATEDDVAALVAIRSTPEVQAQWRGTDLESELYDDLASPDLHVYVIEDDSGTIIGAIQWEAETDPEYRHAGIDIYIDPAHHNKGRCTEAVRTLARYLFEVEGHHRLTIDPAADNAPAIRCYRKVGFRTVGVMRRYERDATGEWHDGLLMELLSEDFDD